MRNTIFLIGFMGSGKSYWANVWGKKYNWNICDLDEQIQQYFGMDIPDIFEKLGEAKFREIESELLKKINVDAQQIVSCGGGVPVFFDNMDWMLSNGITIYLKATPQFLQERLLNETSKRPLLSDKKPEELLSFIESKLEKRHSSYERANYVLDVENLSESSLTFLQ
jgi:shikimate kinase